MLFSLHSQIYILAPTLCILGAERERERDCPNEELQQGNVVLAQLITIYGCMRLK
jgi:hypothetical protein